MSNDNNTLTSPTSSRSVTETVNGSRRFVIHGQRHGCRESISQAKNFTVAGIQRAIYFYPDGKNPEDNSTYVSAFIALASEGINCTVGVVVSAIDCPRLYAIKVPESDIGDHFGMLLENEENSDVIFNVSGTKFHAHKLLMAARSPIFEAQLFDAQKK